MWLSQDQVPSGTEEKTDRALWEYGGMAMHAEESAHLVGTGAMWQPLRQVKPSGSLISEIAEQRPLKRYLLFHWLQAKILRRRDTGGEIRDRKGTRGETGAGRDTHTDQAVVPRAECSASVAIFLRRRAGPRRRLQSSLPRLTI
jgi:hypothetical protein